MTKKELQEYGKLKAEKEQIKRRIEKWELEISAPQATKMTGIPSGGNSSDKLANDAVKLLMLKMQYQDKLDELAEEESRIEEAISKLEVRNWRLLIRARYIEGKDWEDIAKMLGYSEQHTFRIHGWALQKLTEL